MNIKVGIGLFFSAIACAFLSTPSFGQTEKLGGVSYAAPQGWNKTLKENVVGFSKLDQSTGVFCIITLYGATPGTGSPAGDFSRDWNKLVVGSMKAEANPKTETQLEDGWTITAGGSAVESEVGKAVAFLTVISGSGKTVSVLGVFNDQSYLAQYTAFVSSLDIEKTVAAPVAPNPPPVTENGKLVIPPPTRQLTVADLAGEWGEDARISTTYVDRYSGTYAGTDTLAYRSKHSITARGGYLNDFFAIQNGKKILEKTSGTVTIVGRLLSIKQHNTAKYVIRGWLELPDMTIITICGPWYDDDVIPERIFSTMEQGANLNKNWVRKK